MKRLGLMVLVSWLWVLHVKSQVPVFWEPDLNLSGKLAGAYTWNTKLLFRLGIGQLGSRVNTNAGELLLTEAQGFVSRRLLGGRRITFGLLYGLENPVEDQERRTERRLIWQYSFINQLWYQQLSHRIRVEQRFFDGDFQHRVRYRTLAERPLQGERLDKGEWYILLGMEFLLGTDEKMQKFRLDNRFGLGTGLLFKNEQRMQIELQHRAQRIFDEAYNSRLWILTSWIVPM